MHFVHPKSVEQLKTQIDKAMKADYNEQLHSAALKMDDWHGIAGRILNVYKELI